MVRRGALQRLPEEVVDLGDLGGGQVGHERASHELEEGGPEDDARRVALALEQLEEARSEDRAPRAARIGELGEEAVQEDRPVDVLVHAHVPDHLLQLVRGQAVPERLHELRELGHLDVPRAGRVVEAEDQVEVLLLASAAVRSAAMRSAAVRSAAVRSAANEVQPY